ncbi:MAG TPA: hypothetical protein VJR89_43745 [Polyangiales bacterium]|nr:hypothetical protein [Polyangiales bacterium]
MPKAYSQWKVLPHDPIQRLAENLWWVQGSLPNMSLKRVMVVVRLADGRLVIHNGIALEEAAMQELERWGKPAFLIVPGAVHRLDAPAYKARYPELRVFCPRGARKRVAEVVAVDGTYEEFPSDRDVRFEMLNGVRQAEGAMLVRSADGVTVVLNDAMFNMDRKRDVLGFLITTLFGSAPGPRVSRLAKLALVQDKRALREDFARFAELPDLARVIVAHEKIASGSDARSALRAAMRYL